MTLKPWQRLERRADESAIEFVERKIRCMGRFNREFGDVIMALERTARTLMVRGDPGLARVLYLSAMDGFYELAAHEPEVMDDVD